MPSASYLACSPTTLERVPVKEDRNIYSVRATSPTEMSACPACGSIAEFGLSSSGKEPGFWYRLKALVDRAIDQGALAVLPAHRAIKAAYTEADLLLGVDLTFNGRGPGDLDRSRFS